MCEETGVYHAHTVPCMHGPCIDHPQTLHRPRTDPVHTLTLHRPHTYPAQALHIPCTYLGEADRDGIEERAWVGRSASASEGEREGEGEGEVEDLTVSVLVWVEATVRPGFGLRSG